jgi:hypothetical protein
MGTWARPVPSPGQIHSDGLILRPLLREHQGDRPGVVATEQRSLRIANVRRLSRLSRLSRLCRLCRLLKAN